MISLYIQDGFAYVWNAEDWHTLRSRHRICGSLIGSSPSYPRQNEFLGLPMALMTEEAALLVEKGICELYELPDLCKKPSEEDKQNIKLLEQKLNTEQKEVLRQRKIDQISQKIDVIVAGKRKKLISQGITDVKLDKEIILQEKINELPAIAPGHVLVHLPTQHYINKAKNNVSIEALKPVGDDKSWHVRYAVFKDLWEKGHYLTCGSKFGCDYLVYPGDPVKFHATYMARCITDQTRAFSSASFVAYGRLSVSVNKLALLAFCDSYGRIEYQTLRWHDSVNG